MHKTDIISRYTVVQAEQRSSNKAVDGEKLCQADHVLKSVSLMFTQQASHIKQ